MNKFCELFSVQFKRQKKVFIIEIFQTSKKKESEYLEGRCLSEMIQNYLKISGKIDGAPNTAFDISGYIFWFKESISVYVNLMN